MNLLVALLVAFSTVGYSTIDDEVNRQEKNGYFLFEGHWEPETPVGGLDEFIIEPSSADGKTKAQIKVLGASLAQTQWTNYSASAGELSTNAIGTRNFRGNFFTSGHYEYHARATNYTYSPRTGYQYSPGQRFTFREYHSCLSQSVTIRGNPKLPDRLEYRIWYNNGIRIEFPDPVQLNDTATAVDWNRTGSRPKCVYSEKEVVIEGWLRRKP